MESEVDLLLDAVDGEISTSDGTQSSAIADVRLGSRGWANYVMSFFSEAELVQGCPRVIGLRRVATLLLGPIVSSKTRVVSVTEYKSSLAAVVESEVQILWTADDDVEPHVRTFSDAADVTADNTDSPFCNFAVAVAATRAEGRALRKALQLETIAAEELSGGVAAAQKAASEPQLLDSKQKLFIETKSDQLGIDSLALVNLGSQKFESLDSVPADTAKRVIEYLNQLQRSERKIPESIRKAAKP